MPNKNRKVIDNLLSRTKIYIVIIAILLIAICIYEPRFIIPAIIIFLGVILYTYQVNKKRKAEISNHIHELVGDVERAIKYYKEAIDSDHQHKEANHNIELLLGEPYKPDEPIEYIDENIQETKFNESSENTQEEQF